MWNGIRLRRAGHGLVLIIAVTALCVAGCSSTGTYPVTGKVVYGDGTPATELAGFTISLDSNSNALGANGVVQPDGSFIIGTHQNDDGALPGTYRVALTPPEPPLDQPAPPAIIDRKYSDLEKSGLTVEVKAENNVVEIKVERLKK